MTALDLKSRVSSLRKRLRLHRKERIIVVSCVALVASYPVFDWLKTRAAAPTPEPSLPGGYYEEEFTLVLDAPPYGKIYYTTDGSCYQYNISGLTPGKQYKIYISYDSTRYYITGGLKVEGLGSEELTTIETENNVQ